MSDTVTHVPGIQPKKGLNPATLAAAGASSRKMTKGMQPHIQEPIVLLHDSNANLLILLAFQILQQHQQQQQHNRPPTPNLTISHYTTAFEDSLLVLLPA